MAAAELTERVLSDVQRSSNEVAALNAYLQAELEAARKGLLAAQAATGAAEQKALALEVCACGWIGVCRRWGTGACMPTSSCQQAVGRFYYSNGLFKHLACAGHPSTGAT